MRCLLLVMALISVLACGDSASDDRYIEELEGWRKERLAGLNAKDGWLSLVGLYRLDTSRILRLGSAENGDVTLPSDFPAYFGTIEIVGGQIELTGEVPFEINGIRQSRTHLTPTGHNREPTQVDFDKYRFLVLDRAGQFFLRLRNLERPEHHALSYIPHFTVSAGWALPARLNHQTRGDTFKVKNILGQDVHYVSEGLLEFEIEGVMRQLVAFAGGGNYFVMFSDETTSRETYGGGRYLYVPLADEHGWTTVDFNKAENPPCVFTEFATCPLPPTENSLPLRVIAGEQVLQKGDS